MISLASRGGINIESIIDQLNLVVCPSYATIGNGYKTRLQVKVHVVQLLENALERNVMRKCKQELGLKENM